MRVRQRISGTKAPSRWFKLLSISLYLFGFLFFSTSMLAAPRLIDDGHRVARHGKLYWLDNDRLLFFGGTAKQGSAASGKNGPITGMSGTYLWNLTERTFEHFSDWEIICYHPEYSRWSISGPAKNEFRSKVGKFGQEKAPQSEDLSVQQRADRLESKFSCKTYLRSRLVPPAGRGRYAVVLHDGDGYLDLGPALGADIAQRRTSSKYLTLYQAKTGKAIQLSITTDEEIAPYDVSYSTFQAAYVLRPKKPRDAPDEKQRRWSKARPPVVYLLWPDGRIETILIPYLPSEYTLDPRPVKGGLIFGGGNFYKASGLYFFDGKTSSKIDTGLVQAIEVTSDGCKAAVAIQRDHLEMGTPILLRVFDFCVQGG